MFLGATASSGGLLKYRFLGPNHESVVFSVWMETRVYVSRKLLYGMQVDIGAFGLQWSVFLTLRLHVEVGRGWDLPLQKNNSRWTRLVLFAGSLLLVVN